MRFFLRFVLQSAVQVPILLVLILSDVAWLLWVPSYVLCLVGTEVCARDREREDIFGKKQGEVKKKK
jgi:hypothetical protein